MNLKKLTILGDNEYDIAAQLERVKNQIQQGFTSGKSLDGSISWDLSDEEA